MFNSDVNLDLLDHNDKIFYDFSDINNIKISNKYRSLDESTSQKWIEIIWPDNSTNQFTILKNVGKNNYESFKNPNNNLTIVWSDVDYRNDYAALSIFISHLTNQLELNSTEIIQSAIDSLENFKFDEETMMFEDTPDYSFERAINNYSKVAELNSNLYKKIFTLTKLKNEIKESGKKLDEMENN